ncbi:helix-turn-helix domain-containing protein [Coprococcus eutactus]|uniref:helix-turn-helix domain-containing protein n=1 Tax=Coprococcus eutactus TaxID=33043 RepID=UPI001C018212|nr:helix-turn-helix domain-containing protein [Coprococcus eutactus]
MLEHIYYKLDTLLNERKKTKTQLCKDTGISTNVVSKISKNEIFKTNTLNRISMSNQAKLKNM